LVDSHHHYVRDHHLRHLQHERARKSISEAQVFEKNVQLHVSSNKNNFSFPKPQLWASWSRGQVICIHIVEFLKILRWPNSAALHSKQQIFLQITPIFLLKYLHNYCSKIFKQ
jgi:hypothetical protein